MRSPQPTSAMEPTLTKALKPTISLRDRKSTRLNSSHPSNSYAVFRSKKKLKFRDTRKYPERVAEAVKLTGESEAMVVMSGSVHSVPVVLACFEFACMGGSMGSVVGER